MKIYKLMEIFMDNTKQKTSTTEQRGNTVTKPPVSPNKGKSSGKKK